MNNLKLKPTEPQNDSWRYERNMEVKETMKALIGGGRFDGPQDADILRVLKEGITRPVFDPQFDDYSLFVFAINGQRS